MFAFTINMISEQNKYKFEIKWIERVVYNAVWIEDMLRFIYQARNKQTKNYFIFRLVIGRHVYAGGARG